MQTDADGRTKAAFRRRLLSWFDRHQRDLPWRVEKNPYKTWVSEIMLQQTQVATVIDYFNRFMKRFPTVKDLASAREETVLKYWEGLGYYRRAKQMHAAAKKIVDEYQGRFPEDFEQILALPGIGRYTAGAIASIALEQRHPVLEGNTFRLFTRLLNMQEPPRSTANEKKLWAFSEALLPKKRIGDFNQALMELGALVCTPKQPSCLLCPVSQFCQARMEGTQDSLPVKEKKTNYVSQQEAVVIVQRNAKTLVRLCGAGERWAGLWDFPRFILPAEVPNPGEWLVGKVQQEYGLTPTLNIVGRPIRHAVTKYRITLGIYQAESVTGRFKPREGDTTAWVSIKELEDLPLNSTGRKIANRLTAN